MNLNNLTIKSQEALQQAQQIAQSFGQQQLENEHIFKAILEVDTTTSKKSHSAGSFEQIV